MNCPVCQQTMKKVRWSVTSNQKIGVEYKEYDSTTYRCETDDAWVNVEVPANNKDSIPCDIVLLPTNDLARKAINLSEQLEERKTLFTLKADAHYPHASLYMTQLKSEDCRI